MVTALLFTVIASALAASYLAYSSQDTRATKRMIDYQKCRIAAECALEYGVLALRDVIIDNQLTLAPSTLQVMLDGIDPPTDISGYQYFAPNGASSFRLTVSSSVINGIITRGIACVGSDGETELFTITIGARNPNTGVGAVLEQQVQAVGLFLIRYGVFYERDLEINPGAQMVFRGPVHCNADMYLAPDNSTLSFEDRLTAVGEMYRRRKDCTKNVGTVTIDNERGQAVGMTIDSTNSSWMITALRLWNGRVLSRSHGIQHLSPPIAPLDDPHAIIERTISPTSAAYRAATEAEKFEKKSCLRVYVSNRVVKAVDCLDNDVSAFFTNAVLTNSAGVLNAKDSKGQYLFRTNGLFGVAVTNFYDDRQNCYMRPVDVYVNQLTNFFLQAVSTNYTVSQGRGVIYISRWDPDGPSNGVQPCVRIRNARCLPAPLTIASDLPIYLEGDINTITSQPFMVAGDAVTLLSGNWQDAYSAMSLTSRVSSSSNTYNVVVMAGNSETQWGTYNGGLENVLRFLEDWDNKTVIYRGSIIDLWYSESVTNAWGSSGVYTPPDRDWGYDEMYRYKTPPGMPRVFGVEEISWSNSTWAVANFN